MKLNDLINDIKRKKTIKAVDDCVSIFSEYYEKKYQAGNLRINDSLGEGVFFVRSGRDAVDSKTKEIGKNTNEINETTYSRGLFNQKTIKIDDADVDLISYEAPLLRQKRGMGGGKFKLDLLGFIPKSSTVLAIECKFTGGNDTNPQYGIIESFFYALAIKYSLDRDLKSVKEQINKCYTSNTMLAAPNMKNINVAFCVMAPHEYWKKYFTRKWSSKDILKTQRLITNYIDKKKLNMNFIGYSTMSFCSNDIIIENRDNIYYPKIRALKTNVLHKDFSDFVV